MVLPLGCWGIGGGVCELSLPRDPPPRGTSGSGIDCRLIRAADIEFLADNDGPASLLLGIGGGGWLGGLNCGGLNCGALNWGALNCGALDCGALDRGWLRCWLDVLWSLWPLTCAGGGCCFGSMGILRVLWSADPARYPGARCVVTRVKSASFIVGGPGGRESRCSLVWTKLGGP